MQAQTDSNEQATGRGARGPARVRSHLFTVRLCKEEGSGAPKYRGTVREVASGAFRNFRDWADLTSFMTELVEEAEGRDQDGRAERA